MKKTLLLFLIICFSTFTFAQNAHGEKKHLHVEDIVSDLTTSQKKQLNLIREEAQKRIDGYREQQKLVKDSISMFLERDGNESVILNELFDRDASLQASISKELYSIRVRIDALLTAEQRSLVRKTFKAEKEKRKQMYESKKNRHSR